MGRRHFSTLHNDLWTAIINHQNTLFYTAKGLPFTYTVTTLPDGTVGNEMLISRKSKSITRATVNVAYERVLLMVQTGEEITGPKQLRVFGASYLYAVFRGIGVIGGGCCQEKDRHSEMRNEVLSGEAPSGEVPSSGHTK